MEKVMLHEDDKGIIIIGTLEIILENQEKRLVGLEFRGRIETISTMKLLKSAQMN